MSFLSDFYNKAKKKLYDWEQPVQQSVSSSLGEAFNSAKNYLNSPAPDWMQKIDTGLKNFSESQPEEYKPETFESSITGSKVGDALLGPAGAAYKLAKTRFNFGETAKSPVGKFAGSMADSFLNLPNKAVGVIKEGYGEDYLSSPEGRNKLLNRVGRAAEVGTDIGLTIAGAPEAKGLGAAGFAGKQALKDSAIKGAKEMGSMGLKAAPIYIGSKMLEAEPGKRVEAGLDEAKNQAVNVMAMAGLGAASPVVGAGLRKVVDEPGKIKTDVNNFKNPYSKRVVTKVDYEPVPDTFSGGQNVMRPVAGTERKVVETVKTPFEPQSMTGKLLTARPGLNIEDVNIKKPKVVSTDELIAQKRAKAKNLVEKQIDNQRAGSDAAEPGFVAPQTVKAPEAKKLDLIPSRNTEIKTVTPKVTRLTEIRPVSETGLVGAEGELADIAQLAKKENWSKDEFLKQVGMSYIDNPSDMAPDEIKYYSGVYDRLFAHGNNSGRVTLPEPEIQKKSLPSIEEYVNDKPIGAPVPAVDKALERIKPEWRDEYKMIRDDLKQVVKNEADQMMAMKDELGGVGLYKKVGEGEIGGDMGMRKFSSNPTWYRDFYKKNGRAPRKWEVIKIAEDNLKNGEGFNIEKYNNTKRILLDMERESLKADKNIGDEFSPVYNKYQQRAFDQKQKRINQIDLLMNYPSKLREIGYKKAEINRIGKSEAEQILRLADLGYPKNEIQGMDFDRRNLILKNDVSWSSLKNYYERKHALDTNFLEGIDPTTLNDINPSMGGLRDSYRNFEVAFGKNYPKIKEQLLNPFDQAKGDFIAEQQKQLQELADNVVKKLGIKKGSDLSAAVQTFGEGKMTLQQLKEEFPNDWQKVVKADEWFKSKYDTLLTELNKVREANYPTHPLYPESTKIIPKRKDYYRHFKEIADGFSGLKNIFDTPANIDPSLAVASEFTKPKTKWLSFAQRRTGEDSAVDAVGGFLDYIKSHSYAKHIDPFIQKFRGVDAEAKSNLGAGAFMHETRGLAEELSQKMDPIQQMTESGDQGAIRKILTDHGVSERQSEWMSKEISGMNKYEDVQNFLKKKLSGNKNGQMVSTAFAEKSDNKLNNFLKFINNYANDLAGKTNPFDRPAQDLLGRKAFRAISWVNSRVKANTVLGNAASSLAQLFNVPQGFAQAGIRNSARGLGDTLAGIFKNGPIAKSNFINERYFNDYAKFDSGFLKYPKKMAIWMTEVGDEIGTKFIWNSLYNKAQKIGMADPVKYADDWTRKMVAGRGVGEVPILQKAKVFQVVAPFQLEVANQWHALSDMIKDSSNKKEAMSKLVKFMLASYLMNRTVKAIRGSDASFDPVNSMVEAYKSFQDEKDKLKGSLKAGGRVAGEFISNLPLGQSIAEMYPEYGFSVGDFKAPIRKDFFGNGDPTRFGGGLLASKAVQDPLYKLIPPFSGGQAEKTVSGILPLIRGYAENNSGKVMTPVEKSGANIAKGLLFGKNALGEVQNYYDTDQTPLSDQQTEKYKLMGNDLNYFNKISDERKSNKEREALKTGKSPSAAANLSDDMSRLSNGNIYVKSLDKEFKNEKEAGMAIAMEDLANSDENFRDLNNGWVIRKGEDGNITKQRRDSYDAGLNTAKLSGYKKNDDLKNWKDTADKQLNLLSKMIADPSIDDYDKAKIQNAIDTLISEYQKYNSYGGFTKPKKGRKLEEKYRYPLVDPDMLKIQSMIAGTTGKKFILGKKPLPLIIRRLPAVHRTRRRK